ncbi:MAG TPA: hypothetical protein VLA95_08390 [Gemmatimonadales bacterium]|nr:hypothetical protein [Gemmatimonadales bacterium]
MEGLGIVLVVAYLVFSFISEAVKRQRGDPREEERRRARAAARARAERLARAGAPPPERGADLGTSPTQVEARRLEELLRSLGGLMEEPEEAYSLEGRTVEAESGDAVPLRAERVEASADDAADAVVQRRIAAAEARSGALGPADHEAFHLRLARQETARAAERPVRQPGPARRTRAELRRAVVWREILGPPVSLRGGDPV